MRTRARRDASEAPIIQALELKGWSVFRLNDPGFPDLLVARRGVVRLLEVKSKRGAVNPRQAALHRRLFANGVPVHVVRNQDEAIEAVRGLAEATP